MTMAAPALATPAEEWAAAQVRDGKPADFDRLCQGQPDTCRRLPASAVVALAMANGPAIVIVGAHVEGDVDLAQARLERALVLRKSRIDGSIRLDAARAEASLEVSDSQVTGELTAAGLRAALSLDFSGTAFAQAVVLRLAQIDGHVDFDTATLAGPLEAWSLQVGSDLLMRQRARFAEVNLAGARVGGNLDLEDSTLASLDLTGARIAGALVDTRDGWPARGKLRLAGFGFGRLAPHARTVEGWDDWARRDPAYSPTPYAALARAFTRAGNRAAADHIRYLGRMRQRETEAWPRWIADGLLDYGAGYGIGDYGFRLLGWLVLALLGALAWRRWR